MGSWRACLGALPAALPLLAQAQALLPPVDGQGQLSPAWRVVGLPQQKPPLTRYQAARIDGRDALQIDAQASYGNFVLDVAGQAAPRHIAWSWRVEQDNPAVDLRNKAGDDTVARVCLSFQLPLEQVPFMERQLLRMARASSGQPLPSATLCWVWGGREAPGSLVDNPYSRRVRYLVLRNAADGTHRWLDERRDVAADWRRAFGDESPVPPPLAAVIVAGDADNTVGHSRAGVAGLSFTP